MHRNPTLVLLLLAALGALAWLPACGDDDAATDGGADGDTDTDTDTDADADADAGSDAGEDVADDSFSCWDGVALGEEGFTSYLAFDDTDGNGITEMSWVDDQKAPSYAVYVESWQSYGGPTGPGTYEITATETNYTDCGLCVRLLEVENGTATHEYMPVAGSGYIQIDSLTIGTAGFGTVFSGSYDLDLQEVALSDQSTPVEGGCAGGSKFAWSGKLYDGVAADVGSPLDDATFTGFADADGSNTIDTDEQVDVDFSYASIFADTGKKTLIVVEGAES